MDPFETDQSLGEYCSACALLNGSIASVPDFSNNFSVDGALPADVDQVELASGQVQIIIQNGFSFDPIAGGGSVTISVMDGTGGAEIGQVSWNGATEAIPGGATVSKTLVLAPATVNGNITARVDVVSVGGQTTRIDTGARLTATATPTGILVSSATVAVANRIVDFEPVELELEDLDENVTDNVERGAIDLMIQNPFGVSVTAVLDINHPGGVLRRTLEIPAAESSSVTLEYTGDEIRSFIGKPNVTLSGSGTASAPGGTVRIEPTDVMILDARLDLTLRVG